VINACGNVLISQESVINILEKNIAVIQKNLKPKYLLKTEA
jgi:hypothetical protein